MPDKRERDCWWMFISGRPETEWNPPKKPKSEASFRRGRRYSPQYSPEFAEDDTVQETWHINNEGEVELQGDAVESLPTPSGTPAPPDLPESITRDQSPREPTPSVVSQLDHVGLHIASQYLLLMID